MAEQEGVRRTGMWTWDGTRWSSVSSGFGEPALSPMPRSRQRAAGLLLLDGGIVQGNTPFTWLWQREKMDPSPRPRHLSLNGSVMRWAYDSRRKRVVMFGGHSGFGPGRTGEMFGDTWEWTGEAWERVHPRIAPGASFRAPTGSILRSWPASSP